jgi:MFS family permease
LKTHRKALLILFLTVFIDLVGFGMVIPLLALYGHEFHASSTEIGLLGGVYSFMQFLMAPVWGSLSDRFGRRPILLSSLFGIACAYVVFSQATTFSTLFWSRALAGFFAANISTAVAYVADVTSAEDRAKGMGFIGAAFGLGFVFGPAIGGIAGQHGMQWPPIIAAVLSFTAFLLAMGLLPESRTPGGTARELGLKPLAKAFSHPVLSRWMYAYLLYMVAVASMEIAFPLLVAGPPFHYMQRETGYLFTYLGLVVAAIQGGAIRRMKRSQEAPTAKRGTVFSIVGLAMLPFVHTLPLLVLGLTCLAIGQGFTQPTLMGLISRNASSEEQGTVLGVSQSLASFGRIVGPPLAGLLYGWAIPGPFLFAAAVVVAVLALIIAASQTPLDPPQGPAGA